MSSNIQDLIKQSQEIGTSKLEDDDTVAFADSSTDSEAPESYDTEVRDSDSTVDAESQVSGDTPKDQSGKADPKAEGNQNASNKEVITITDDKGRRQIEIDYSNKEAIKKAFQFQYGARKWQAERDQAIQTKSKVEADLTKIRTDWGKLDEAFAKGPEHLVDLLQGPGAFDRLVNQRVQRMEFMKNASPEEIQALESRERAESTQKELDKIRKEQEEFKKQVMSERETAEERALESKINPVFDKYRFAEKLGNPDDEQMFDEMLWNSTLKRLEKYEEQGLDLSKELVEREFRGVATAIRKRIGAQADKTVSKVVEQKKREATENVQAKVMSGYKSGGAAQEARDLLSKGDVTSLLKGWGKYGSLLGGNKKK